MIRWHQSFWIVATLALLLPGLHTLPGLRAMASGQEDSSGTKSIIDFTRDVRPILEARCLGCHGPEDAKNDFRIDETDSLFAYVEASDLEGSSLWTDYLLTDDVDMLMPPAGSEGQPAGLSGAELAVIKLWIEEGAQYTWTAAEGDDVKSVQHESPSASLAARIWTFQGLFHPASVHFPLALLMVSALFVFLSIFRRQSFEPVAYHCLWIGALGAVGSCLMGWAYAVHEGYGNGFGFDLRNSAIDRHRWLGIGVAVLSVLMVPVAHGAYKTGGINKKIVWLLGSMAIALGVSITGYQGGELTYGEDHYQKEFERLFPEYVTPLNAETQTPAEAVVEVKEEKTAAVAPAASATPANTTSNTTTSEDADAETVADVEPDTDAPVAEEAPADTAPETSSEPAEVSIDASVESTESTELPDADENSSVDQEPAAENAQATTVEAPQPTPPTVVNPSQPKVDD